MVVLLVVERVKLAIIDIAVIAVPGHVIRNDVQHEQHAPVVDILDQGVQLLLSAVFVIQAVEILLPVAGVRVSQGGAFRNLAYHRGYPDGVEAHVLYVIEVVRYALPSTAAILLVVGVARWA